MVDMPLVHNIKQVQTRIYHVIQLGVSDTYSLVPISTPFRNKVSVLSQKQYFGTVLMNSSVLKKSPINFLISPLTFVYHLIAFKFYKYKQ